MGTLCELKEDPAKSRSSFINFQKQSSYYISQWNCTYALTGAPSYQCIWMSRAVLLLLETYI